MSYWQADDLANIICLLAGFRTNRSHSRLDRSCLEEGHAVQTGLLSRGCKMVLMRRIFANSTVAEELQNGSIFMQECIRCRNANACGTGRLYRLSYSRELKGQDACHEGA